MDFVTGGGSHDETYLYCKNKDIYTTQRLRAWPMRQVNGWRLRGRRLRLGQEEADPTGRKGPLQQRSNGLVGSGRKQVLNIVQKISRDKNRKLEELGKPLTLLVILHIFNVGSQIWCELIFDLVVI